MCDVAAYHVLVCALLLVQRGMWTVLYVWRVHCLFICVLSRGPSSNIASS